MLRYMLEHRFPNNKACIEKCGKIAACLAMHELGTTNILSVSPNDDVDFETEDGRRVSFEEFTGIQPVSDEVRKELTALGSTQVSASWTLARELLSACKDGAPLELTGRGGEEAVYICRSREAGAVEFTAEDIYRTD